MVGSQILNASWISPSRLTISVEGDADLITIIVSPYGSSPPSIPIPTTEVSTQTQPKPMVFVDPDKIYKHHS
jgi:hypothetical protein